MYNLTVSTIQRVNDEVSCNRHRHLALFSDLSRHIFVYFYPIALVLCLFGNTMNLILYSQPFLRGSTTIRLLAAKAVANIIYMVCLANQELQFYQLATESIGAQKFYWFSIRMFLFMANTFGTAAAWLTVVLTLESYICVAQPMKAQRFSTHRNAKIAIICCILLAGMLNIILLVNRWVEECYCSTITQIHNCVNLTIFKFYSQNPPNATAEEFFYYFNGYSNLYETIYKYLISILAVFFPAAALIILAIGLNYELYRTRQPSSSTITSSTSVQKQCVNRLTLGTTFCHLIFESPQVAIYIIAALEEDMLAKKIVMDFSAVANYLSMLNASVPFVIYYICSRRFRILCTYLYCSKICPLSEEDLRCLETQTQAHSEKRDSYRQMYGKRSAALFKKHSKFGSAESEKDDSRRRAFSLPNANLRTKPSKSDNSAEYTFLNGIEERELCEMENLTPRK